MNFWEPNLLIPKIEFLSLEGRYEVKFIYRQCIFTVSQPIIWQLCPSHSISVHENDILRVLLLLSFLIQWTKHSQFLHVHEISDIVHYIMKHYHFGQDSESEIWERFNFCLKNARMHAVEAEECDLKAGSS